MPVGRLDVENAIEPQALWYSYRKAWDGIFSALGWKRTRELTLQGLSERILNNGCALD